MAIESQAERDWFFDPNDFGQTATFTSPLIGDIEGIFDSEDEVFDYVGTVRAALTFTASTDKLTGVSEGSTLTICGKSYAVRYPLDDGTGVTTLQLKNA